MSENPNFLRRLDNMTDSPSRKDRWKAGAIVILLVAGAPMALYWFMRFADREWGGGGATIFAMIWLGWLFMWQRFDHLKRRANRVVERLLDEDEASKVFKEAKFRREQIKKGEWQREEGADRISWFG